MNDMFDKIDEMENKITLQSEDGEPIDFYAVSYTHLRAHRDTR